MQDKAVKLSDLYSRFYQEGSRALKTHDPCKWSNGQCAAGTHGCCQGCKHLGPEGCTVEALACKLWLCYEVSRRPENQAVVIELRTLRSAAAAAIGVPFLHVRASKEETFQ
jgi:hypothetical protein